MSRKGKNIQMKRTLTLLAGLLFIAVAGPAAAHDDHCSAVVASVEEAGFADSVAMTCDDHHATITSDTYPDHALMTGITAPTNRCRCPQTMARRLFWSLSSLAPP